MILSHKLIEQELLSHCDETLCDYIEEVSHTKRRLAILLTLGDNHFLWKQIKHFVDITDISSKKNSKKLLNLLYDFIQVDDSSHNYILPEHIQNDILNEISDFTDPYKKWFIPFVGSNDLTLSIIDRLMIGLTTWEDNEYKRYKHIVENMIYVSDTDPRRLFKYMFLFDFHDRFDLNIYLGDINDYKFEQWHNEFDITVMHPPYNKSDNGGRNSSKPIYHKYVKKIYDISKYAITITPSNWFSSGKGLNSFRDFIIKNKEVKSIQHYPYPSLGDIKYKLMTGLSYIVKRVGDTDHFIINGKKLTKENYDIISPYLSESIFNKVQKYDGISKIANSRAYFKIGTYVDDSGSVKCHMSRGKISYVNHNITKPNNHYLVVVPRTNKRGFEGLFIIKPNEVHSDSFMSFRTDTQEQAESLMSFLNTKFANYLLWTRKSNMSITINFCKWIPLIKLDQIWTDGKLIKLFSLKVKEVELINEVYETTRKIR